MHRNNRGRSLSLVIIMKKLWIAVLIFLVLAVGVFAILTVDVIPQADKNYDLGNLTHRYGILYVYNISIGNATANHSLIYYNGTHVIWDT